MDYLEITGGHPLKGTLNVSGAKNAALPLLCVPLLTEEKVTLKNMPCLKDVSLMTRILSELGCSISFETVPYEKQPFGQTMTLQSRDYTESEAHYDLIRQMRAGMLVMGPLLARYGRAKVSLPGGCAIGARPVDIHLEAFQQMGADISLENGYILAKAPKGLQGADITLRFASVGATENLLMAATLATGTTVIRNAAMEPEIIDLAECLIKGGAKITGHGTSIITIEGVSKLSQITHSVMYDRIEAGTYMIATAMTHGELTLRGAVPKDNEVLIAKMQEAGVDINILSQDTLKISFCQEKFNPIDLETEIYPGFPTDLQAQFMAMMCLASGSSTVKETIFENRFMHVSELSRMGADISVQGSIATIAPIAHFSGADVMATDLRASSCLILAALAAKGTTRINRLYHLDRGYEAIEEKLWGCGIQAKRLQG